MRAVWALALVGCVPKGRYELVHVQLDATRTALSAQTAQAIVDAGEAEAAVAALQRELDARQAQLDELVARAAVTEEGLADVEQRELELLDALAELRVALEQARAQVKKPAPAPPPAPVETLAREEVAAQLRRQRELDLAHERALTAVAEVRLAFAPLVASGRVTVVDQGEVVVVRVPTGQLFQENFSTLSPRGRALVESLADALRQVPGRAIAIEGHTDDRKVHTAEFPSNWERGFAHALAVLRGLDGVDATLSAASLADTRPVGPNDTPEGRAGNERIELWITTDPGLATRFAPTPAAPPPEEE